MKLSELVPQPLIKASLAANTMEEAFTELLEMVGNIYSALTEEEQEELCLRLMEREELSSTVMDDGVAIPHIYHDRFRHLVTAFGRCREGIDFGRDVEGVRGIFLILVPEGRTDLQVAALNKVTSAMQRPDFWRRVMGCADGDELHDLFCEVDGVEHG